jgi:multiple sugar transport system ATP-binding protein
MEGAQGRFVLPVRRKAMLSSWLDQRLILGIRPEQITQPGGEQSPECSHTVECRVDIVEPTGPDTLVFTRLNDTRVVCRVHPGAARRPGEIMPLVFDMSRAVFFDPVSERRIV